MVLAAPLTPRAELRLSAGALMKQYFDSIPREVEEAALIDGASYWKTFYKIII